jgi:GH18 family chitinase
MSLNKVTHLIYAFATLKSDFTIGLGSEQERATLRDLENARRKAPKLRTLLSVGGWSAGGAGFSNMVATATGRRTFINSAINTAISLNFNGIDIDWEYPGVDRGGRSDDGQKLTLLLKEFRQVVSQNNLALLITMAIPSGYYNLKAYEISQLELYVDWFNVMTYDYHGNWDLSTSGLSHHAGWQDMLNSLQILGKAVQNKAKIVPGLAFYGRSYVPDQSNCVSVGCKARSPGPAGPCTAETGSMSFAEIEAFAKGKTVQVTFDSNALTNYALVDSKVWISYDNTQTLPKKVDEIVSRCFGGIMFWSIDQDNLKGSLLSSFAPGT